MRRALAFGLFAVLAGIAVLHAYWGLGGLWPAETTEDLIRTVIGVPDMTEMPSAPLTLLVAGLILASGTLALLRGFGIGGLLGRVIWLGCAVQVLVFGLRGLSGLAVGFGWIEARPPLTEPFASLDFTFYSPLCLAIALGFALLLRRHPQ